MMLSLLVQLIFTPLYNYMLLRNKLKNKGQYFSTVALGLLLFFIFDFVYFDNASAVVNSLDLESPYTDFGYFQLRIPRAY